MKRNVYFQPGDRVRGFMNMSYDLRSSPERDSPKVGTLSPDEDGEVLQVSGWDVELKTEGGCVGWIGDVWIERIV